MSLARSLRLPLTEHPRALSPTRHAASKSIQTTVAIANSQLYVVQGTVKLPKEGAATEASAAEALVRSAVSSFDLLLAPP